MINTELGGINMFVKKKIRTPFCQGSKEYLTDTMVALH